MEILQGEIVKLRGNSIFRFLMCLRSHSLSLPLSHISKVLTYGSLLHTAHSPEGPCTSLSLVWTEVVTSSFLSSLKLSQKASVVCWSCWISRDKKRNLSVIHLVLPAPDSMTGIDFVVKMGACQSGFSFLWSTLARQLCCPVKPIMFRGFWNQALSNQGELWNEIEKYGQALLRE